MLTPENQQARRAYHKAFIEWMTNCSGDEIDCFVQLQQHKPDHKVIPMMKFMEQCLADPQMRDQLPKGLLERLKAANWPPAQAVCAGV